MNGDVPNGARQDHVDPAQFRPPQRPDLGWVATMLIAVVVGLAPLFVLYPVVFSWLGPWDLPWSTALLGAGAAVAVRFVMDVTVIWEDWLRKVSPDQGSVRATVQLLVADVVAAGLAGVVMLPEWSVIVTSFLVGGAWMVFVTLVWDRPWESTAVQDMESVEALGASFRGLVDELEQDGADTRRRQAERLNEHAESLRREKDVRSGRTSGPGSADFPVPDARGSVHLDPYGRAPRAENGDPD
ncbi:MAG: hypothetical protein DI613_20160 [Kocuria rhizophila]|nr:MAG: hypothetical protein DI613_20160 [Kocuria rhizophila]